MNKIIALIVSLACSFGLLGSINTVKTGPGFTKANPEVTEDFNFVPTYGALEQYSLYRLSSDAPVVITEVPTTETTTETTTEATTTFASTTTTTVTTIIVTEAATDPVEPEYVEPVYIEPEFVETEEVYYTEEDTSEYIEETYEETVAETETDSTVCPVTGYTLSYSGIYDTGVTHLTSGMGVTFYNGHRESWYSEKVLPGNGLSIPGRHVADDGTIRDENGYICVASRDYDKGTILMVTLGPAKVYDYCDIRGTVDVYVNW